MFVFRMAMMIVTESCSSRELRNFMSTSGKDVNEKGLSQNADADEGKGRLFREDFQRTTLG